MRVASLVWVVTFAVAAAAVLVGMSLLFDSGKDDAEPTYEEDRFDLVDDDVAATFELGAPGTWAPWTSPEGGFSIDLPGEPATNEVPVDLPDGGQASMTIANVDWGAMNYAVAWSDLGPGGDLESAAAGSAVNTGGEVTSSEPVTLDGMQALRYRVDVPEGAVIVAIAAFDGQQRFFTLTVVGPDARDDDLDRMASSFALDQ